MQALYDFMLDKDNLLAGVHELAREAHFSEDNLRTFDEDRGIPSAILDALFPVTDKSNTIGKARSTHAHGNREPEISAGSPTDTMEGHEGDADGDDGDGRVPPPFIIETSAVMPTGEHMAKSADLKPSRLMTLQAKMKETAGGVSGSNGSAEGSLGQQANAEAAAAAGRAPPKLPENALSSPTPATWFRTFTTIGFSLELAPISFLTPGVATWTTGSGRWTSKGGVRFVCCNVTLVSEKARRSCSAYVLSFFDERPSGTPAGNSRGGCLARPPKLSRASPLKTWRRRPEKWRKALELGLSYRTVQLYGRSSLRCSRSMPGLRGPSTTNGTRDLLHCPSGTAFVVAHVFSSRHKQPDRVGGGRR